MRAVVCSSGSPYTNAMPWMTTEEAARELGYHVEGVRMMLRAGRLKGEHFGHVWMVDSDSVAAFKAWVKAEGFAKHDPRRGQPE